jgi:hypothetical protein
MKISVCINVDTRDGFEGESSTAEHMFEGCRSADFLVAGVLNKMKFFDGFDKEIILHVDEHNTLPNEILCRLREITDTLVVRKHTHEISFNDWTYLRTLQLATGDIICHVDQDTACYTDSKDYVQELIDSLEGFRFVSYPSHWTPHPVHDDSFQNKFWASTRFFLCKKETLKLDELAKCIEEPEWMYAKYGDSPRRCNWTEHYLAKINDNDVYYPPIQLHRGAIFSWASYKTGTLNMLNNAAYEGVKQWIIHRGGIQYPVDVKCD